MKYLDALFKDINDMSNETKKISVTPYEVGLDCVATDWEVYSAN